MRPGTAGREFWRRWNRDRLKKKEGKPQVFGEGVMRWFSRKGPSLRESSEGHRTGRQVQRGEAHVPAAKL